MDSGYYWDRHPATVDEDPDHIGPGGSVFRNDIVADRGFFTEIPDQFRMLDDIWFCERVRRMGWHLGKLPVEMQFVMEETNQYRTQGDIKAAFWDYLHP